MADFPLIDQASLLMVPSATKEGKLYSQLPTDGSGDFTFTRATSATRVNEEGYIEKGYENTLLGSNDWARDDSSYTITGGEAGYDGTNDAWLVNKLAAAYFSKDALVLAGVMTISFFAKAGSLDRIFVFIGGDAARFDLTNGEAFSAGGATVSQNIELVSGTTDWYRCSIVINKTGTQNFLIKPQNSSNQDVTGTIYIQDGMLNQGLVAYPYLETTTTPVYGGLQADQPRLDYSGGATCPSLLLEPSRTNLVTNSEYIPSFSIGGGAIISLANVINPQGTLSSYQVTSINNGSRIQQTIGPQGNNFVYSGFFKGTGVATRLRIANNLGNEIRYDIDANGIFTIQSTTSTNYGIEDYGNGWNRIYFETTTSSASNNFLQVYPDSNDGNGSIYVWGLQVEQGSYPTSYIPTYGTTQTRLEDVCNDAGDASTFNSSEGVLYFEGERLSLLGDKRTISISDGSVNNYLYIQFQGVSNTIRIFYKTIEFGQVLLLNHNLSNELGLNKYAFRWSNNNFSLWINGTKELEQLNGSTATSSVFSELNFALGNGFDDFYGNVKQVLTFNTALTDTECIALTTL